MKCTDEHLEEIADIFKVLGNKNRLRIVIGLKENKCNVNDIAGKLQIPQSTTSQHLSVLRAHGVIRGSKDGTTICYQVVNKLVLDVIKSLEKLQ